MKTILKISQLSKVYGFGYEALKKIDLDIYQGEIFALLGPNGVGNNYKGYKVLKMHKLNKANAHGKN
jgi:ABC-type branched-subunit amino acid transport system ATPase component